MTSDTAALDRRQIRRAFSRWARHVRGMGAEAPALIPAQRLWERLQSMAQSPVQAADVGGDGAFLAACYPQARVLALDWALPVLVRGEGAASSPAAVCGDAEALPLAAESLQLLWSNLCVEWTDYRLFFGEAARVLQEGGLFAFTTLGPDSLREMRQVFADEAEARVHDFTDMHELGDALMASGFTEPLLEAERLTFTYASAADALTEARRLGAGNARAARAPLTKTRWRRALEDYARHGAEGGEGGGRVCATYEVVYATAWRAPPRPAVRENPLHFYRAR